jgi:quinoprotein glucose dehydrogenase
MTAFTRRLMITASATAMLLGSGRSNAQPQGETDWKNYANDLANTRYAPLDQIDASNFEKLELVWRFSTNALGQRLDADFQSTPLVVNGRLYTTAGFRRDVVCLDPATGELIWLYRRDEGQRVGTRGGPGFGLAYWSDGSGERVIFVTRGYQLVSLDAKTGIPDPAFGKDGVVELRDNDDQQMDLSRGIIGLHAAPLVAKNIVVVGAAPSPFVKGYVRGFDVTTGQRKWIFHTVPRKGEFGYDSWLSPDQTETVGNIGAWAPMSADPDLGLVFVGVELPQGDMIGTARLGPALFGETMVALNIETGERRWHYQFLHHGLWDRDVSAAGILCDIPYGGKLVKAIAVPSKQAFLYVLNRETGKPLWPIPEKPVPDGDVPGEWYSPTQPVPSRPPPFDKQTFTTDDLIDWTPEIKARALAIASHYRMGDRLYTPPTVSKPDGHWGTLGLPGTQGGANWPGGSYDPETHMVYIYSKTAVEIFSAVQSSTEPGKYSQSGGRPPPNVNDNAGGGFGGTASLKGGTSGIPGPKYKDGLTDPIVPGLISVAGLPLNKPPYGRITAIDLKTGTIAWQITHGETPDALKNNPLLKGLSIPRTGQAGILGTLTTKSLVICGDCGLFTDGQGRKGARLRAYDKMTGEEKGAVFLDKAQTGAAMTYMHEGRQYIVTAIGGNFGADLVAFCLPA